MGHFVTVRLPSGLLTLQLGLAPVWAYGWQAGPPLFLLSLPLFLLSRRGTGWDALLSFGNGAVWTAAAGLLFRHLNPSSPPGIAWHDLLAASFSCAAFAAGNAFMVAVHRFLATGDLTHLRVSRAGKTFGLLFLVAGPPSYLLVLAAQTGPAPEVLVVSIWVLVAMALKGFLELHRANVRLQRALTELQQLSSTDPLTGLYNRRQFMDLIHREFSRHTRYGQPLSLLLLDLRNLKRINDTRGHPAGDAALCAVADALRSRLRTSDLAFRIGGDEFTVLLPNTDPRGAYALAQALYDRIRSQDPTLDVTIGVAGFPEHARDVDSLIAAADTALYRARATGDPVGVASSR